MKDQKSSHFKIGTDEESPDSLFQAEITDQRVDKLSQRLTLITILIPCLICILLFVAYLDVKKRFITVKGSGAKDISNISENLKSNYSSISVQFAKLEESIANKILTIEKTIATLDGNLKKTNKLLNKIKSSKSDKKELSGAISKIEKKIVPIRKDLKKVVSDIKNVDTVFREDLAKLTRSINNTNTAIKKWETEISTLSSDKIDQKTLDLTLKVEQQSYLEKLNQTSKNLENKLSSIQKKIKELEKKRATPPPSSQQKPKPIPSEKPADKLPVPEPGKIIEQDIQ